MPDKKKKLPALTDQVVGVTSEGRKVFKNADGSESSERSATMEVDGRFVNFPTIFGGKELKPEDAFKIVSDNGFRDPETGRRLEFFKTEEEAVRAAQIRSRGLKNERKSVTELFFPNQP